jgi:uncharacterized membrane protein
MFEWLFNYPRSVFSKGEFVLLGAWPKWILLLLFLATAAGLAWLIRSRLPQAPPRLRGWRAALIWIFQTCLAALLLTLLWQPAIMVAELKPQQNIIAVMVDDSRSMAVSENGSTRHADAIKALQGGVLTELQKKFQTRLYRMDGRASRINTLDELQPSASAPATHIGDSLKQLAEETADLPVGAVVVLTDGADNSGGVSADTISALRNRRIPVHTVGFGLEQVAHDIEVNDVNVAPRALADSRLSATVTLHQRGYAGQKATLSVREGEKVLTSRPITLSPDGAVQTETLLFNAGSAGAKGLQFSVDALPDEQNRANNVVTRMVNVDSGKRRVLYVEGEPRWEYKFIRRAEDDDRIVQIASMLRTTENKIYRQGVNDPSELGDGFPSTTDALFGYEALVVGSVEASYFTPAQQDLIRQFVDRRGGGLLLLGGRFSLGDGGWGASTLADLLPLTLPNKKGTFHRDHATVALTSAGAESAITRLTEDPARNADKWKKLPYLQDYQEVGAPKPGAAVLAELTAAGKKMPLLVTQNFGRGRTAVLATSGTWRWQMSLPLGDQTHDDFWRQLLRWLVTDTPGRVITSVPNQMLFDDGRVQLTADIRDKDYNPVVDARVEAHMTGPQGTQAVVQLAPDPNNRGIFHADWNAEKPGVYTADITASRTGSQGNQDLGHDSLTFQRVDGVAENFHTEQNRSLLEHLSAETGGRYWRPQDLPKLASDVPYSEAGITIREAKDLWNMPVVFLLILVLRASEWLLRRQWGIV